MLTSATLMLAEGCRLTRNQGKIRADFLGEVALALSLLRTRKGEGILRLGRDLYIKMLPSLWPTPTAHTPCSPPLPLWASANTCCFTSLHSTRWGFL